MEDMTNAMQRQQSGMRDNGMERKTRPMLGALSNRGKNIFSEWYTCEQG